MKEEWRHQCAVPESYSDSIFFVDYQCHQSREGESDVHKKLKGSRQGFSPQKCLLLELQQLLAEFFVDDSVVCEAQLFGFQRKIHRLVWYFAEDKHEIEQKQTAVEDSHHGTVLNFVKLWH